MQGKFKNDLSPELKNIIDEVVPHIIKDQGRNTIYPRDIVVAFFQADIPVVKKILQKFRINKDAIYDDLLGLDIVSKSQRPSRKGGFDSSASFILQGADRIVTDLEHPFINVEHVICAFLSYPGRSAPTRQIKITLQKHGLSESDLRRHIIMEKQETYDLLEEIFKDESSAQVDKNKQSEFHYPEKIEKLRISLLTSGHITNLNESVKKQKEKFIGRNKEVERCMRVLLRKKKKNVIIIGEAGTGKTCLVEGIATNIIENNIPEKFKGAEIYSVNLGNIISGTKYRGQFEERMKNVIYFMEHASNLSGRKVIMFIDEIHTLCNTGSAEGAIDASSIMKPVLAKGDIQCIGTTTLEDYRKHILKDSALTRRFSNVFLDEPSVEESEYILRSVKDEYEKFHNIKIKDEIIKEIINVCDRYIKNRNFPDKAFDVLDEACAKMINNDKIGILDESIVFDIVSEMTGIPITTVCGEERKTLSKLDEKLKESIIGQDSAIDSVSNAIKRARIGLKDPNKPIGTYIFLGPTGTGKTLLSKKLSEILFGKDRLIRLDMSEYMDKTSVNKITGSAPGYVGYEEGSKLAEEVRKRPYSVILLDEIEKAHKDVLNVFLQVLDEGRLTDALGRIVDFSNTIIIMTSNLATSELGKKTLGFDSDSVSEDPKVAEKFLMEKVGKYFSPEFINRLDETVIFNNIKKDKVKEIFNLEFKKTKERIGKLGYQIEISEEAINLVCEEGYSEKYGARPMGRSIQKLIETPFASYVLNGTLSEEEIVYIDIEGESLSFKNKK